MTNPFHIFEYPGTITIQKRISAEHTSPQTGITTPAVYDSEIPIPYAAIHTRSSTRFITTKELLPEQTYEELILVTDQVFEQNDIVRIYSISGFPPLPFAVKGVITERPLFQSILGLNNISYQIKSIAQPDTIVSETTEPDDIDQDGDPEDESEDTSSEPDTTPSEPEIEDLSW